jgi:hypothetical protein
VALKWVKTGILMEHILLYDELRIGNGREKKGRVSRWNQA